MIKEDKAENNNLLTLFALIAIVLIIFNIYTGLTVKKIGIPGIFEIEFGTPTPAPTYPTPTTPITTPVVTFISGKVFDKDTNLPLAHISIIGFPGNMILATTAPDGSFESDLSHLGAENYPLRIVLAGGDSWYGASFQSNEYLDYGKTRKNVIIYVSDKLMRDIGSRN